MALQPGGVSKAGLLGASSFLGSSLWYTVPNEVKNSITIHDFNSFVKHWKGQEECPSRPCKLYIVQVGF